jgi:hypothetical protein
VASTKSVTSRVAEAAAGDVPLLQARFKLLSHDAFMLVGKVLNRFNLILRDVEARTCCCCCCWRDEAYLSARDSHALANVTVF